ncbi:MAG: 3' terminal RNA ribose 2'-O-methyltransferase Hen1 [Acidobacteria bacterium]|nr:3' terminal RNA ribose 2'-O-methyltransferase Hen1 [Acidobacteriota bacterium]MBV9474645.1 3' terminal RNA ribose 2'-O-methyltransferase Hen1 [Acidobacteriota bacterium]
MLLTITTTHRPATDLGYLLHKNPARLHRIELAFGEAYVAYPEATEERCTAALVVDVDTVGLVRRASGEPSLFQYVNDRPYAASSFLSVAMVNAFRTAMAGRSKDRPELVATPFPLELRIVGLPCRGGEAILRQLFEPLGYEVDAEQLPLDERFPEWGGSRFFNVTLRANVTVRDALSHLYVCIPVLDAEKHYWVGDDEVDKLLRHGAGWLAAHPHRNAIARRYLKHKKALVRDAVQRLVQQDMEEEDEQQEAKAAEEETIEKKVSLNERRMTRVLEALREHGATSVIDLGCGEGRLLRSLMQERAFTKVGGMDVSTRALEIAREKLRVDTMPERQRAKLALFQGSLVYRDKRLREYDAATAVEVIEHLDPLRLSAFERVVFGETQPRLMIVTTPNVEYNVRFESLPAGRLRHRDHRFEWTRAEFRAWAARVATTYGYACEWLPIGDEDADVGPPTQMAVFTRTV